MRVFSRLWLTSLLVVTTSTVAAQDLTHPMRMGLPGSDFKRPSPSDFQLTLDNGLSIFVAEARQVPLVTLSAFIRAGLVDDGQQGSAETLLDSLRSSGTATLPADAFTDALKQMTADFTVEMHDEWTEVTLNVPTEDLEKALAIFAELLRMPGISTANIDRAAESAKPDADDLGGEDGPALYEGSLNAAVGKFYDVLYGDHPYGTQPSVDDFKNLNVADVVKFHSTYFVPGNMVFAIAGDIDADAINTMIVEQFDDWRSGAVPEAKEMPAVQLKGSRQHSFPAGKLQSWLVFGHELQQVADDDKAALEVMNYILAGGHLWTRMTIETRYKYGYTNDASGFLEDKWFGPGGYNFRSYSRPEVIKAIYDNMMEEIFRIQSEEVSDEELFVAKGALTEGNFQVRYLDGYRIARNFALEKLRYGDHDRSATYVERIRAVTAKDVLAAAVKFLRPDDMQVILVGQPEELLD